MFSIAAVIAPFATLALAQSLWRSSQDRKSTSRAINLLPIHLRLFTLFCHRTLLRALSEEGLVIDFLPCTRFNNLRLVCPTNQPTTGHDTTAPYNPRHSSSPTPNPIPRAIMRIALLVSAKENMASRRCSRCSQKSLVNAFYANPDERADFSWLL